jgi:hypothetical protein
MLSIGITYTVKNAVFWDVAPCKYSVNRRSSETLVHTRSTRRHTSEDTFFIVTAVKTSDPSTYTVFFSYPECSYFGVCRTSNGPPRYISLAYPKWRISWCFMSEVSSSWLVSNLDHISRYPNRNVTKFSAHKNKLRGLSPPANYTDRATAVCRRSYCQL